MALSTRRAAEEAKDHIRWLRTEYQTPFSPVSSKASSTFPIAIMYERVYPQDSPAKESRREAVPTAKLTKTAWPKTIPEGTTAVELRLASAACPSPPPDSQRSSARPQNLKSAKSSERWSP